MLLSKSVSHHLATSADLEPSERERSGNRKILTVSPTPYGSYVWNYRLVSSPATT